MHSFQTPRNTSKTKKLTCHSIAHLASYFQVALFSFVMIKTIGHPWIPDTWVILYQLHQFWCLHVTQPFHHHFNTVLIADYLMRLKTLWPATHTKKTTHAGYCWQGLKTLCSNNLACPRQHLQGTCKGLANRNLPCVCWLLVSKMDKYRWLLKTTKLQMVGTYYCTLFNIVHEQTYNFCLQTPVLSYYILLF